MFAVLLFLSPTTYYLTPSLIFPITFTVTLIVAVIETTATLKLDVTTIAIIVPISIPIVITTTIAIIIPIAVPITITITIIVPTIITNAAVVPVCEMKISYAT
jgi:hypothetical protein